MVIVEFREDIESYYSIHWFSGFVRIRVITAFSKLAGTQPEECYYEWLNGDAVHNLFG